MNVTVMAGPPTQMVTPDPQ